MLDGASLLVLDERCTNAHVTFLNSATMRVGLTCVSLDLGMLGHVTRVHLVHFVEHFLTINYK
jgi:hypothetical protein